MDEYYKEKQNINKCKIIKIKPFENTLINMGKFYPIIRVEIDIETDTIFGSLIRLKHECPWGSYAHRKIMYASHNKVKVCENTSITELEKQEIGRRSYGFGFGEKILVGKNFPCNRTIS